MTPSYGSKIEVPEPYCYTVTETVETTDKVATKARPNKVDFIDGDFVVRHANGKITFGKPEVKNGRIAMGCTSASIDALRELLRIAEASQ